MSENCVNLSNKSFNYENSPIFETSVRLTIIILYGIVAFLSVCGNSVIIYLIVGCKNLHSVTNVFIANLAIADLVITSCSLWVTPAMTFDPTLPVFSKSMCDSRWLKFFSPIRKKRKFGANHKKLC